MCISQVYVSREIVREIIVEGNRTAPWVFGLFLVFLGVNVRISAKGKKAEEELWDALFNICRLLFFEFDKGYT